MVLFPNSYWCWFYSNHSCTHSITPIHDLVWEFSRFYRFPFSRVWNIIFGNGQWVKLVVWKNSFSRFLFLQWALSCLHDIHTQITSNFHYIPIFVMHPLLNCYINGNLVAEHLSCMCSIILLNGLLANIILFSYPDELTLFMCWGLPGSGFMCCLC